MELPTYSAVFGFEKRLYAIYDLELPVPVSLFQAGVFLLALAATLATTTVLGIGLTAASAWVFVVPPATAAYLASRPLADGKRPHHWLVSQARHLTEPRTVCPFSYLTWRDPLSDAERPLFLTNVLQICARESRKRGVGPGACLQ